MIKKSERVLYYDRKKAGLYESRVQQGFSAVRDNKLWESHMQVR